MSFFILLHDGFSLMRSMSNCQKCLFEKSNIHESWIQSIMLIFITFAWVTALVIVLTRMKSWSSSLFVCRFCFEPRSFSGFSSRNFRQFFCFVLQKRVKWMKFIVVDENFSETLLKMYRWICLFWSRYDRLIERERMSRRWKSWQKHESVKNHHRRISLVYIKVYLNIFHRNESIRMRTRCISSFCTLVFIFKWRIIDYRSTR